MTASPDGVDRRRRLAALFLSALGVLILGAVALISIPFAIPVLRDPSSHEAQDAGMAAIFLLIPGASVGIMCLGMAFALWATRAIGMALVTALAVVAIVILNMGGGPLLWLAIGVALTGTLLTARIAHRDWRASRSGTVQR